MPQAKQAIARFVDFERPPVIEVAVGLKFKRLERFATPHFGLLWSRLIDRFPRCEDAPPIVDEEDISAPFPATLARSWLIDTSNSWLVQIQPNRFHVNWRKQRDEVEYPHFEKILATFEECFSIFSEFLVINEIGPIVPLRFELTYVNHIFYEADGLYTQRLNEALRDINWNSTGTRFLSNPHYIDWRARFRLPNEMGELVAKMNPARRKQDDRALFILDMTARGLPNQEPMRRIDEWFSLAHEWIVKGFADLTTPAAHERWGRRV